MERQQDISSGVQCLTEKPKTPFELAVESKVGLSIEVIRSMSPDEYREFIQRRHGGPMKVVSKGPFGHS